MSCSNCYGIVPGCPQCGPCATPSEPDCDPDAEKGYGLVRPVDRGTTLVIAYGPIVDYLGVPVDFALPGAKAWFTVKRYLYMIDSKAEWQGTIGSGIVQESRGVLVVTIPPTATVNAPEGVDHLYYDLRGMDSSGRVGSLEKGRLAIGPAVTRANS